MLLLFYANEFVVPDNSYFILRNFYIKTGNILYYWKTNLNFITGY